MTVLTKPIPHRQQKVSYDSYLEMATETQICEWVDEEVITYMPLGDRHQNILVFLTKLLGGFVDFFNLGVVRVAPFEVKLWPNGPSREPDILFLQQSKVAQLTAKRLEGPPDLVVEIISPSSVREDRVRKFREYEQAGVTEYWLIDSRPRQQQADFYLLSEAGDYESAALDEVGCYHSPVLSGFWFDVAWLQGGRLPNSQLALAQIMMQAEAVPPHIQAAYRSIYEMLSE